MRLKHLTIDGFKSFAKKGELEFSSAIVAVVGPNGSGKSNVAEAFRFVLGEQSLKSLRSKRGEDLIFNGSRQASRVNRAAVTLLLDNTDRVFPLDFDEVAVGRVVHRDGQNEYHLNGSKVRLKDVHELLAAGNIGATGHHIISQGEADRILSAGPRERREMIEDALGLKIYQYKKDDAEKKLNKTRENLGRVAALRKEMAPHIGFLNRQMKKAEREAELRGRLNNVYAEYLKREEAYLNRTQARLRAELKKPAERGEELTKEIVVLKDQVAKAEDSADNRRLVELEEQLRQLRGERQAKERALGQLEGQIDFLTKRLKQLEEAPIKTSANVPAAKLEQFVAELSTQVEKQAQSDDVSHLRRALRDVVHMARKFFQSATETARPDTAADEAERRTLESRAEMVAIEVKELAAKEAAVEKEHEAWRESLADKRAASRAAEQKLFVAMNEVAENERLVIRLQNEEASLERDHEDFKREVQEAVALLGRGAAQYFEYEIKENGQPVGEARLANEPRTAQLERRRELEKLKIRLEEAGGENPEVEKEYKDIMERDEFLAREITDLETSMRKLETLIKELNIELDTRLKTGLDKIGLEFQRFFALMFGGGEACLKRVAATRQRGAGAESEYGVDDNGEAESENKEAEGVEIDVNLPNKRVRGLEMLSGGERALTSIALIFAMSQVHPPPFIILDETDAALDEANSRRYGDMIEALAERSQLILITHNRETMSRAGVLYGVTMGESGTSKLLSVKFEEAAAVAKS